VSERERNMIKMICTVMIQAIRAVNLADSAEDSEEDLKGGLKLCKNILK
jgi:hypothetical protein